MQHCPGQDQRFWKPDAIFEAPCPHCGTTLEFWKDDAQCRCPHCRKIIRNPKKDIGCAQWCQYADQCLADADKLGAIHELEN